MQPAWPESRLYRAGAALLWVLFLASLFALNWGRAAGWPTAGLWLMAAVAPLTVGVQFYCAYRLIMAQDEFLRGLTARRMIAASGLAITVTTAWSLGEVLGLPHLPAWLLYPLFWGAFGVVTPFIQCTS
jgi:hypothetical protein